LLEVVSKGRVKLEEVSSGNNHPSGFHYGEIYNAARRYAVMPDRGREGRRKRFVLTITNPTDGIIIPVGLLEASDGPPQDSIRDSELYLTPKKFTDWLLNNPNKTRIIAQLLERLDKIKSALRPIKIETGMDLESEEIVYKEHKKLNAISSGRSKLFEKGDKQDPLWDKKKINYLVGIVRFKHALIQIQAGKEYTANDISNGVRILRNLSIPRSNLDISICVGLPPFSYALIGKLLIAFFGDPRIRAIAEPKQSIILKKVFFFNRLNELLPKDGALVITTKGLYPGYSVQYERAHAPGKEGNIRLRKVGHTVGETTSFISQRTDVLGKELMEYLDEAQASSIFGSGGSKRQRRIETAVDAIGLPREMVHPKFNRPIYSLRLVDNIPEIIYLNEKPNWLVPEVTPDEYELLARESWFQRWKNTIERRVCSVENDHIHGLQEVYENKGWVTDE
jgi:hypothetical protein